MRELCKIIETVRKAYQDQTPSKTEYFYLFHQDNVPAHKTLILVAAVRDYGCPLFDHNFYSPWLTIISSPT